MAEQATTADDESPCTSNVSSIEAGWYLYSGEEGGGVQELRSILLFCFGFPRWDLSLHTFRDEVS